ncbi:unnamed protein product, partial [Mesorhabditis spiculigera]
MQSRPLLGDYLVEPRDKGVVLPAVNGIIANFTYDMCKTKFVDVTGQLLLQKGEAIVYNLAQHDCKTALTSVYFPPASQKCYQIVATLDGKSIAMPNDGDNQTVFTITPRQLRIEIQALSDTGQCATYHQLFANSDAAKDYRILLSAPQGIDDDDKYLFRKGSEGKYIYYRHATEPQPRISFELKGLCAINFFKGLIESETTQFYGQNRGPCLPPRCNASRNIFALCYTGRDQCGLLQFDGKPGDKSSVQYTIRHGLHVRRAMAYRVNATCEQLGGSGGLVFGLMNPIPAGMEVEVAYANRITYSTGEDTFWTPSSARGIGTTLAALLVITLSMP